MNSDEPEALRCRAGRVTRRQLMGGSAALGVSSALIGTERIAAADAQRVTDPLSAVDSAFTHEMRASSTFVLAGEAMDERRIKAMRNLLETNLKEIELLRQFDPEEEEPVTRFRPW